MRLFPGSAALTASSGDCEVTRYRPGEYYRCTADGHQVILVRESVSELDRMRFRAARIEFAACQSGPLILVFVSVDGLVPWNAIPYAWPLTFEAERRRYFVAGPWPAGHLAALQLMLVDSSQRCVVARRSLACDAEFSAFLHASIRSQAQRPFNAHDYVRAVAECALVPAQLVPGVARAVLTEGEPTLAW